MHEKKLWTLVALAGLMVLTLVRPERDLDGHPTSRPVRTPPESDGSSSMAGSSSAVISPHTGSAWLLFRADWGAVLWRVYQKMNDNRLLAVAAGVVFYGLLAVFPGDYRLCFALRFDGRSFDDPRAAFARDRRSSPRRPEYPE